MINPFQSAEAYHHFKIGETNSPGIVVSVDGWDNEWDWDEKKGKGTKKASVTHTGQKLSEGSFTVAIWTAQQWADWESFYSLIGYNTDKKPAGAFNLYYPTVSVLGVIAVVTRKVTRPMHAGKGRYVSTFSFKEWVPEPKKNATNTPKGSASPPTKRYSYIDGAGVEHIDGEDTPGDKPVSSDQSLLDALLAERARNP